MNAGEKIVGAQREWFSSDTRKGEGDEMSEGTANPKCYACGLPIGSESYGTGQYGPIHWGCYEKMFPTKSGEVSAPAPTPTAMIINEAMHAQCDLLANLALGIDWESAAKRCDKSITQCGEYLAGVVASEVPSSAPAPTPTRLQIELALRSHKFVREEFPVPMVLPAEIIAQIVNLLEPYFSGVVASEEKPTDERVLMVAVAEAALAKINDYPKEVRDWLRPTIDALRELRDMAAGKK